MIYFIITLLFVCLIIYVLNLPQFGKRATGKRLIRIKNSSNYKNGSFKNINYTPALAPGHSTYKVFWNFFFKTYPNTFPSQLIPHIKTDLKNIPLNQNVLVWFGHSSYYFQLHGKKYLVDPVFSGNVSPLPSKTSRAFNGSNSYNWNDIPEIDYLLITHDHYDHLDYKSIIHLKSKVAEVICPLGVGSHLEYWGISSSIIKEGDWFDTFSLSSSLKITLTPTRHFAGRIKRNSTLWSSFVLESENFKMYIGGDSGYDTHFKNIGDQFGPFDFTLLENGQFNEAWQYIHMFPNELLKAAEDLQAKRVMPIHNSKFKLAHHPWNEPMEELVQLNNENINLCTPKIGEVVYLDKPNQTFDFWWRL